MGDRMHTNQEDINELKNVKYAPLSENEIIDIVRFENNLNQERNKEVYILAFQKE